MGASTILGNRRAVLGETGFLGSADDLPAWARELLALVGDPTRRSQWGIRRRPLLAAEFSSEQTVQACANLYHAGLP